VGGEGRGVDYLNFCTDFELQGILGGKAEFYEEVI
jgi:hypothetical protein